MTFPSASSRSLAEQALAPSDVRVWVLRLDTVDLEPGVLACLTPDERDRASRYRFERDARRYKATRAALRHTLARMIHLEARELRLEYSSLGQPTLAPDQNAPDVRFSVTHTSGLAAIAVTTGRAIGIDLEQIRPIAEFELIARRNFATTEQTQLFDLPADERLRGFLNVWTCKEAYLKALGLGLSRGLDRCAVSLAPGRRPELVWSELEPGPVTRWSLATLDTEQNFVGALAVEGPINNLQQRLWEPNEWR